MGLERSPRPSPRERTFAELFPWRNMRRVLMLVVLILAIVAIKHSMGPLLGRASQLWDLGPKPAVAPAASPPASGRPAPSFGVHLGPTLSPGPNAPLPTPPRNPR